ncbi:AAA family ATPase [Roseburia hominis]
MERTVAIGKQDFEKVILGNYFYVDKTSFIREWWESGDDVTLITRPRRFGKTLTMSMTEQFFSVKYKDKGSLFENLSIWQSEKYRELQGTYPVISLSFANVKEDTYEKARLRINQILEALYNENHFLLETDILTANEKEYFLNVKTYMDEVTATMAIHNMSKYLARYYGKKVIILLDEYDTPMQEAYVSGFWDELAAFTRSMFNAAFKTNSYLERAIMTGITRVSKESIFSDLNNLEVVTTTSKKYEISFGFTEEEVFSALEEYGLADYKVKVKEWYDGFTFGNHADIYNPWSIINFLEKREFGTYWANSSSNTLVNKLLREGSIEIKTDFEELLKGGFLKKVIDEQVVFNQLSRQENAVWSLLLACGYLKVASCVFEEASGRYYYTLTLTNKEVKIMFENTVRSWFVESEQEYNRFIKALLLNDVDAMNHYMNQVALEIFSYFDTGNKPSDASDPERFYHGFVLDLLVELADQYRILSNRESGFGRYDVMLEPLEDNRDAMILEFKVFDSRKEKTLEETVKRALVQIEKENYASMLESKGVPREKIRTYGFAFQGKRVLIG